MGLVDPSARRLVAVAKVPLGVLSRQAIAHEADILARLEREKPDIAPRLLYVNNETGVAVQEAMGGMPTARKLSLAHVDWLLNMAIPGETISLKEYAEGLAERISKLDDNHQEPCDALVSMLSGINASSILPVVWVHGDFAPWNLKRGQDGAITAVDWEMSFPKGLPLFDLVYFGSIQAFLFKEKRIVPASMKALLRQYLDNLGIDPGISQTLILTCLIEDWLRCHKKGNHQRAFFLFRHLRMELEKRT